MFKLVVLAKRVVAEGAEEDSASVLPHTTLALAADGLRQGATAEMENKKNQNISLKHFDKLK